LTASVAVANIDNRFRTLNNDDMLDCLALLGRECRHHELRLVYEEGELFKPEKPDENTAKSKPKSCSPSAGRQEPSTNGKHRPKNKASDANEISRCVP
jgi:hypothetical protein